MIRDVGCWIRETRKVKGERDLQLSRSISRFTFHVFLDPLATRQLYKGLLNCGDVAEPEENWKKNFTRLLRGWDVQCENV